MHYDAIIAGAGPAGTAAAAVLARAGRSVLLLEKSRHPRHKSCGGGLSARLLPYLDAGVRKVIEQEVYQVTFSFRQRRAAFRSRTPVAYLTRRARFDASLADEARSAGADLREDAPMLGWRETPEGVEVQSRFGKATCSYLIAADGANSRVARTLYPHWKKHLAFGFEASAQGAGADDSVLIDLTVPKGYGWVFSKRSEAAVGVAGFEGKERRPRRVYSDFLDRNRLLDQEGAASPSGWVIPIYRRSRFSLAKGRVLLVGDAGGLVDPLFGEGIYYAIRSGRMAANAAIAALKNGVPIQSYDDEVRAVFYPDFEAARKMAYWIYAFPGLFLEANRSHPGAMELYFGVLRGERSYVAFWKEVRWEFLRKWNPLRRFFPASSRP